jgi:4-hydroxybenzoate polyprenyltransferase
MPGFFIFKKIIFITAAFLLAFLFSNVAAVNAQNAAQDAEIDQDFGLTKTMGIGNVGSALQQDSPNIYVGQVIGIVLSFLGIIFLILIIYAGFKWMLAQGNESEIEKAKQIIIAAVSVLIIVLSAYAITEFIGNQITNSQ